MYKIIGGDQKEYGPVSFDQLVAWLRDNRANGQTLVQKEGGPWVPLGTLPEFASVLGPAAATPPVGTPPAAGMASSSGAFPAPGGGYVPGGGPPLGSSYGSTPRLAQDAVQGPATGLLITGILGAIAVLIGAAFAIFGGANMAAPGPELPPEMRQMMQMIKSMQSPAMIAIDSLVKLAVAGLIIFASLKLKRLESFPLVVTAAILAMVPCTSPCCCVGLPVGIWVLVAIMRPEVKSSFS